MLATAILICGLLADDGPGVIVLQPLGKVGRKEIVIASDAIRSTYRADVRVRSAIALPKMAFYEPRSRYRADRLLSFLAERSNGERTIGLTDKDISTTNGKVKDWGVLGLGSLGGPSCVVSSFRMGKRKVSEREFQWRLRNTVVHELGHTFGLPHCPTRGCVMADAKGGLSTLDGSKRDLCVGCKSRLSDGILRQ